MKSLLTGALASAALFAALPATANVVDVAGTVPDMAVDYIFFTYTGGAIDIATTGVVGPSGIELDDPEISLFVDDGSPIGALTGAFVANNDDSGGTFDSLISLADLAAGSYVLAVGAFDLLEEEARSGIASTPFGDQDYLTTFTAAGTVTIDGVPEPATWAMMIGGFGAVGGAMRGRRRAGAVAAHA